MSENSKKKKKGDVNPTIPIIILNINGLNAPIKSPIVRVDQKT